MPASPEFGSSHWLLLSRTTAWASLRFPEDCPVNWALASDRHLKKARVLIPASIPRFGGWVLFWGPVGKSMMLAPSSSAPPCTGGPGSGQPAPCTSAKHEGFLCGVVRIQTAFSPADNLLYSGCHCDLRDPRGELPRESRLEASRRERTSGPAAGATGCVLASSLSVDCRVRERGGSVVVVPAPNDFPGRLSWEGPAQGSSASHCHPVVHCLQLYQVNGMAV